MESKNTLHEIASPEMEEAVLAALLLRNNQMPDITGWLTPEMFHDPVRGFVYFALQAQYNRGEQPDFLTTEAEMKKLDPQLYKKCGGLSQLYNSFNRIKHSGNLIHYAREIKRHYLLRQLQMMGMELAEMATQTDSDPLELQATFDRKLTALREQTQTHEKMRPLHEVAVEVVDLHEDRRKNGQDCIFTGFYEFDAIMGGLHNGEQYILAGRPGDGKTAFALEMAINIARQNKPVHFFHLEMSPVQTINRLLSGYSAVNPANLRMFSTSDKEIESMKETAAGWENVPLYFDFTPGLTVENIRAQLHLAQKTRGCGAVFIDYLQLTGGEERQNDNTSDIVSRKTKLLKQLARELDCPVIVLSQLNRECESERRRNSGYRPKPKDLRDSGSIEQDADAIIFVHRPERHNITKDPDTGEIYNKTLLLLIEKNRNNNTGIARLQHNESLTRFYNLPGRELFD